MDFIKKFTIKRNFSRLIKMKHDAEERQFIEDIEERETLSLKIVTWTPG